MRTRNRIVGSISLVLIVSGVALIGLFFLSRGPGATSTNQPDPGGFNVPDINTSSNPAVTVADASPEDKTLKVTIPKMARVENANVPYTTGDDSEALKENAAIHLEGTGSPWQEEANVYLAGHRIGYPSTDSFLAFYDLNKLENGDEIYVEDAAGEQYTYRVFKEFVVNPSDVWVTEPVPGKNILTLQTCTLPDYTQRLIVQAELVG